MDELTATKANVLELHGNSDHIFCCTFPSCEIALYSPFEVQNLTASPLETGTLCVNGNQRLASCCVHADASAESKQQHDV